MIRTASAAALSVALLAACAGGDSDGLGPMSYDRSGVLRCSAETASYEEVCGYRVVDQADGSAEIWISNIATTDVVTYRVLTFSQGEFTAADGTALDVSRSGEGWLVSVPGAEYYGVPDVALAG